MVGRLLLSILLAAAAAALLVRPAGDPVLDPAARPADNTAALQRLFDAGKSPLTVAPGPGVYQFAGAVRWPDDRTITVDLGGHATFAQTVPGEPLFAFAPGAPNGWYNQSATIRNGTLAGSTGAPVLTTDNATADPRFEHLLLSDLMIWSSPVSADKPGYGIDLVTGYSVLPRITRVASKFGPLLRWRPGREEPHATSDLVIDQCRTMVAANNRYAPDIWLAGHRNLVVRNTIIEGAWGYAPGADADPHDGATGLLIDNPGPQVTTVEHCWFEHWGERPKGQYQWVVRNPFPGAAGAHQPRSVRVVASGGVGLAVNRSGIDAFTLYSLWPHSGGLVERQGLVDLVERDVPNLWQQDGPAESGSQYESPAQLGRREPAADVLYEYPGGTGADSPALTKMAAAEAYPHRHPTHGACLAVRGTWPPEVMALPTHRQPDGRRVFQRVLASSPHHVRQGGDDDGLWVRLAVAGRDVFRSVPDGFAPAPLDGSAEGTAARLLSVGEHFSGAGRRYGVPARPWVLVYAASASYGRPAPLRRHYGPVACHEWAPGAGPPPGTYARGDVVVGADRTHRCTRQGTDRLLALTAAMTAGKATATVTAGLTDLLEGDWVYRPGGPGRYQVLEVRADGTVRLDRPADNTAAAARLANSPAQWTTAR